MKKLALLLAAGTLILAGCGGDGDDNDDAWSGKTIQLGSIFSTTGDGAAFGPQQLRGAKLAIDEINADDGIEGAKLELSQMNDKADPATSAANMKSLIKDEVLAVLGPTFSNSAAIADPVANDMKTPVLAVSNTGAGIVGDCPYPCEYIFRDSLGEEDAIPANIREYTEAADPEEALILYPGDDPFGRSSAFVAKKAFVAAGVTTHVSKVTATSLRSAWSRSDDAVMITASSGEAVIEIIKNLRASGFNGQILGGNAFNSTSTSAAVGKLGEGAQSAAAWYAGNDSEENTEFIAAYKDKYGVDPDQFAAQAYTGVELLAEAIDDTSLSFDDVAADRVALKTSLEGVHEETPLGDFKFTEDHDVSAPVWIVQMDGKGGFTLVKKLPPE
jgi:branched-chain amino acid transport system substrate-binding protein